MEERAEIFNQPAEITEQYGMHELPSHPYSGVVKLAQEISLFKHPELLKGAMSTALHAVADFQVNQVHLSPQVAITSMTYARNEIVAPIEARLDNPTTRNAARHQAIWFVRRTGEFFEEYYFVKSRQRHLVRPIPLDVEA